MPPIQLEDRPGGCRLRLRATPGARKESIALREDGVLLVKVNAPAVEGAANEAILALLRRRIPGLGRGDLRLAAGERGREKVVEIDAPAALVRAALEQALV